MGIYAAISGAQLVVLQINFVCVVTFGIRAGRYANVTCNSAAFNRLGTQSARKLCLFVLPRAELILSWMLCCTGLL